MKKFMILLAMFTLVFSLAACGDDTETKKDPETPLTCTAPKVLNAAKDACVDPDPVEVDCAVTPDHVDCVVAADDDPVISGVADLEITAGDAFEVLAGITASDTEDGDLTSNIAVSGLYDAATAGIYLITYTITDSFGNVVTAERTLTVGTIEGCAPFEDLIDGTCVAIAPEVITIMHGAVHEIDPFHADYSGLEQLERQELQRAVEARLNVEINYKSYPPSAAWGPFRVSAIIQSSVSGEHLSDIYWSVSTWTQELADNDAIVPVDQYMSTHGANIDQSYIEIGSYKDHVYGFGAGKLSITDGLYYNADLVYNLGVQNPTDLYLAGNWNWSTFEAWATSVQTALGSQEDMYALGGMMSYYAENMIPLNGGSLINGTTGRISFAQSPALDTYEFLSSLFDKGLFELNPQYDAGSPEWQTGKVAMYPGSLWFVNADNRWGTLAFELGFVPYPSADDFTGEYKSPISSEAVFSIASGMTAEREELVFQVWNELQGWKTDEEAAADFENILLTKFDSYNYVEAYLAVYDKVYLELINSIGISAYSQDGWIRNINIALKDGSARTIVDQIKPIYQTALDDYLD